MTDRLETAPRKTRRKLAIIPAVVLGGLSMVGVGYALSALSVDVPFLPALGDQALNACDEDGVAVAFTYGNASNNGVKVTAVDVSGVASDCATGEVYFLDAGVVVSNYSGTVATNAMNVTVNEWTYDFDEVRVVLFP